MVSAVLALFISLGAHATPADVVCEKLLQPTPSFSESDYVSLFDPTFRAKISYAQIVAIFANVENQSGACVRAEQDGTQATLHTDASLLVHLKLVGQPLSGLLVTGVEDPRVVIRKWSDISNAIEALNSQASVGMTLRTRAKHLKYQENFAFAMGSTFKLYVLGALAKQIAQGERKWTDTLAIRDEWKSLPSGEMQNLPAGSTRTLREFATNMIAISDNTAADHLLMTVGRGAVEAMLAPMGNSRARENLPFLTTQEAFKLKWANTPLVDDYIRSNDVAAKRTMLEQLRGTPRSAIAPANDLPSHISTVEWFGTTDDMCNAILSLADQGPEVRAILSKQTPYIGAHWTYAGYKGGSEPGVLAMTYVLETARERACLSIAVNNVHQSLADLRIEDIVRKALVYAESQVK